MANGSVKRCLLGLAVMVSLWLLTAFPAYAQSPGTLISGRLVNGTNEGARPSGLTIALHTFAGGQISAPITTKTDALGFFVFESVRTDVDSYLLTVAYQSVPYSVELLPTNALTDLVLPVYETTNSLDDISLSSSSILIIGADKTTRKIAVMELAQVVNASDRTFVPNQASGGMGFLRFPMPDGATDLQVEADMPQGQAIQVDKGFGVTAPVPPGSYGVAYSYSVPYSGDRYELARTFLMGTKQFRALVPESLGKVTGTGVVMTGETAVGGMAFWMLQAVDIPAGGAISISIKGLPQPSLWDRTSRLAGGNAVVLIAPGVLLMGLGALVVFVLLRRRRAQAPVLAVETPQDRESLLQAVAALDNAHDAGDVPDDEYEQQRAALMAQLLSTTDAGA